MSVWEWMLLIGAISTILNFLMNIIGTVLALKRTHMQADMYRLKMKREREKS